MSDTAEHAEHGMVAAGHPLTAQAGADVLRAGGNAVDAAVGAMLMSFAAEPLLTGLGAGGHMLIAGPDQEPVLLDFFVQAPARREGSGAVELQAIDVSFGDAAQVFYIGPASCGVYGTPAGVCAAIERYGTMGLAELAAPAARAAREGVQLNAAQAYVAEILTALLTSTPECAALWAPKGRVLREGELLRNPELGDALERLGEEGAEPFYRGDIAHAVCEWLSARGGSLDADELSGYRTVQRTPVRARYRDRTVLTNPPPSAGGTLLAYSLALLDQGPQPPPLLGVLSAMEAAQAERTPEFLEGLSEDGFLERFLDSRLDGVESEGRESDGAGRLEGRTADIAAKPEGRDSNRPGCKGSRLGSTTHISVLDTHGLACSVTCTNGEGSGVVVPGTGIHVNNVMGEEDLNPLGFHRHPAGRRMPSMMAPSIVLRDGGGPSSDRVAERGESGEGESDGEVELVLGSAGSNRIRSAILQTIVGVVDRGLDAHDAVCAPRVHVEHDIVYHEPGIDTSAVRASGLDREIVGFHDLNLFFGGVQAVRYAAGQMTGAGDPRRGGVAVGV